MDFNDLAYWMKAVNRYNAQTSEVIKSASGGNR
jgi:hypothetical protein